MLSDYNKEKVDLFLELLDELETAYKLMSKYDSIPHKYDDMILYQVEMHTLQIIGYKSGVTITEIAKAMDRSTSACSQTVKKLIDKNFVVQQRNLDNKREYNLYLTAEGKRMFDIHEQYDRDCMMDKMRFIEDFTCEDLKTYIAIQNVINKTFVKDIEKSEENCQKYRF